MATIVRPRPNHYELLGLTPAATDEEISRAFAREIGPSRPRPLGGTAEISVAYATLRDPAKRRAYDDSLGIAPAPAKPLHGWHYAGPVRLSRPGQPVVDRQPQPEIEIERPRPPEPRPPEPSPAPRAELQDFGIRSRPVPMETRLLPMEDNPAQWKRPAMVIGALFAGVGLLGAGLGWYASRDIGQAQAEVPQEVARPSAAPPAAAQPPAQVQAQPQRVRRTASVAAPAPARRAPRPKPAAQVEQRAEDVPEISSEQVVALTSQAPEAQATLPLSDAVVARTIRRIGYSCTDVASTSPVEGASGSFKITCTSGETYRAAPVRGRYHFRRW